MCWRSCKTSLLTVLSWLPLHPLIGCWLLCRCRWCSDTSWWSHHQNAGTVQMFWWIVHAVLRSSVNVHSTFDLSGRSGITFCETNWEGSEGNILPSNLLKAVDFALRTASGNRGGLRNLISVWLILCRLYKIGFIMIALETHIFSVRLRLATTFY
jgi:hypothetical protein